MKRFKNVFVVCLFLVTAIYSSCKKNSTVTPTTGGLSAIAGDWYITEWQTTFLPLGFTVYTTTAAATVYTGSQGTGFKYGDQFLTNISYVSAGKYSAMGKFTYGTNNTSTISRTVTLTLQNNNTQLLVDFAAAGAGFPEVSYVFQKGTLMSL